MSTINLSVPEEMKSFVESEVSRNGFATVEEYLRSLIREAQRRQARQTLDSKLIEALESGPSAEMTREDWESIETEAMERFAGQNECL